MADEEELEILDGEIPENDEVAKGPTPDEALEVLRSQLAKETERRRTAEARAEELAGETHVARTEKHETEVTLVESAIAEMERNETILQAGLEEALQTGDARRIAEINREMGDTGRKLDKLRDGLEVLSRKQIEKPAVERAEPADPVEAFIESGKLAPAAAEWVRRHPECATDRQAHQRMLGAHYSALGDGLAPNSPEYFSALNAHFDKTKPVEKEEEVMSSASKPSEAPRVASVSQGGGNGKTIVRLTAEEKEMAENMGMKLEDYAKAKLDLQKEGKIAKSSVH